MFKQQKGKSAFLIKKNQQKKKQQQKSKNVTLQLTLQKNIRAFLSRQRIVADALQQRNIRLNVLMNTRIDLYSPQEVKDFINSTMQAPPSTKRYYLLKFIIDNLQKEQYSLTCLSILTQPGNQQLSEIVFKNDKFVGILRTMLAEKKGYKLLNLTAKIMNDDQWLNQIQVQLVARSLLEQFRPGFVELQSAFGCKFNYRTLQIIVDNLARRRYCFEKIDMHCLGVLALSYLDIISKAPSLNAPEPTICYLLSEFLSVGMQQHDSITSQLVKQNQAIIALVEDEELLDQIENKLRQNQIMEDFTNEFLSQMKILMTHPFVLSLFADSRFKNVNAVVLKSVNELSVLFEDRRLIFIRQLISSDLSLRSMSNIRDPMFYQGLKMRLLAMDDFEFRAFNIFNEQQWRSIIANCVTIADIKIQKLLERSNNQAIKLVPFKKRNSDELELKTVVDLLTNLYKKSLRTGKISPELFVDYNISQSLSTFLFGKGARKIEQLIRLLPFVFSFESRVRRFKEFVKEDKKLHDRTLFLQEEVDEDLIIAVRRGSEFLDAFEACMTRDLRKKYKIIFFNQQGLQQQGVDGGGIIKEFINRVLKSAFSMNYSLFMETPNNEILPNPYAPHTAEYELVGKLIGKAVYQTINIEQKFAEPFLNLVIGRQNTFEDMQYIDPDIYKGLIALKNSTEDIDEMGQTFVILDKLPNGQQRYVDLLCPSKPPTNKQVLVTNQNKTEFVLSYADFKCNKQIEQKTRLFRKGFLKVLKPEWLTMFSNQQLNSIISGASPDFNVEEMQASTVYLVYHEKDETIVMFWQVLKELSCEEKSLLLLYITSCSRPPTLGFASMKPRICISRDNDPAHLPTANTCMNMLRLPNYKNKAVLKAKLLYAINAKAGFQFA